MQTYSDYRDSGYKEIGPIPVSWRVIKLRNIGKFTSSGIDKTINENDELVRIINYTDVYGNLKFELKEKDYMVVSTSKKKIKQHQVCVGDLIFTPSSETIEDIGVSALVVENLPNTAFSYHVLRFQFEENINLPFRKYLCNNYLVQNYYSSRAKGSIRKTLSMSDFKETLVIIPKYSEQQDIALYLDTRINQIDTLISKLQIQVEMLETYKRELIAEVVTKGLDQEAPLKDSGIDWIGTVPEYWNITKIKWMFEIVKRIYGAEDRDVLSITRRGIKIKDIDSNDGQLAESYANYQVVNVNDFAMNSMDLLTGWVDCSPYEGVTSPDYRVFRFHPDKPQCHTYYKYLFQMCYTNRIFYRLGQGVSNLGRWRLQADQFLNIRLPQPPIEEQEQIASYLDTRVGQIEELTADIKAQIEKLKEYRKIVIHDAVTGKIKVTEGE